MKNWQVRELVERKNQGPGGTCVCTCGYTTPHKLGQPCQEIKCPKCGKMLDRKLDKIENALPLGPQS